MVYQLLKRIPCEFVRRTYLFSCLLVVYPLIDPLQMLLNQILDLRLWFVFAVNDPFVMKAWSKTYPENKDVLFLADGSAKYTCDLGLELDLSEKGLGIRSKRFALLIEDLKVKAANIESGGEFTISSAEDILKALWIFTFPHPQLAPFCIWDLSLPICIVSGHFSRVTFYIYVDLQIFCLVVCVMKIKELFCDIWGRIFKWW